MQKLYNEHDQRLTRLGSWTSRKADETRCAILRETYIDDSVLNLDRCDDAQLIDLFELYLISESYAATWLAGVGGGFRKFMMEYPHVKTETS